MKYLLSKVRFIRLSIRKALYKNVNGSYFWGVRLSERVNFIFYVVYFHIVWIFNNIYCFKNHKRETEEEKGKLVIHASLAILSKPHRETRWDSFVGVEITPPRRVSEGGKHHGMSDLDLDRRVQIQMRWTLDNFLISIFSYVKKW